MLSTPRNRICRGGDARFTGVGARPPDPLRYAVAKLKAALSIAEADGRRDEDLEFLNRRKACSSAQGRTVRAAREIDRVVLRHAREASSPKSLARIHGFALAMPFGSRRHWYRLHDLFQAVMPRITRRAESGFRASQIRRRSRRLSPPPPATQAVVEPARHGSRRGRRPRWSRRRSPNPAAPRPKCPLGASIEVWLADIERLRTRVTARERRESRIQTKQLRTVGPPTASRGSPAGALLDSVPLFSASRSNDENPSCRHYRCRRQSFMP